MWKWFKPEEVVGLKTDLVDKLDHARDLTGFAFKITSGKRTHEQDLALDPTYQGISEHETGEAVDLAAPLGDFERCKMAWAIGSAGIDRLEIAPHHFHAGISRSKPFPCCWMGSDH